MEVGAGKGRNKMGEKWQGGRQMKEDTRERVLGRRIRRTLCLPLHPMGSKRWQGASVLFITVLTQPVEQEEDEVGKEEDEKGNEGKKDCILQFLTKEKYLLWKRT